MIAIARPMTRSGRPVTPFSKAARVGSRSSRGRGARRGRPSQAQVGGERRLEQVPVAASPERRHGGGRHVAIRPRRPGAVPFAQFASGVRSRRALFAPAISIPPEVLRQLLRRPPHPAGERLPARCVVAAADQRVLGMVAGAFAVPSDLLPYADFLRSHGLNANSPVAKLKTLTCPPALALPCL